MGIFFFKFLIPVFCERFCFEVLSEPIFACLANRDFSFCKRTIKQACFFLYRGVFTHEDDNLGEYIRDIVKTSANIEQVCNGCLMLQGKCSAESSVPVIVADLIL